eukprot:CAMPEP_0201945268 /NCGR_PEP_ID=MMETSP0903-20130614/53811_1 /ASSEMBLY_ACC=CAM_ASM_000552 /TAXON_ID=420261 /ORGANISM="Thalassiosira antarctica, Strain CCMP982" /LENGTH=618 /DNA_ID=CAMNT_0048488331 /DNA_START=1898 /DNA_END=3753 /DNA_ORIENTATION=-
MAMDHDSSDSNDYNSWFNNITGDTEINEEIVLRFKGVSLTVLNRRVETLVETLLKLNAAKNLFRHWAGRTQSRLSESMSKLILVMTGNDDGDDGDGDGYLQDAKEIAEDAAMGDVKLQATIARGEKQIDITLRIYAEKIKGYRNEINQFQNQMEHQERKRGKLTKARQLSSELTSTLKEEDGGPKDAHPTAEDTAMGNLQAMTAQTDERINVALRINGDNINSNAKKIMKLQTVMKRQEDARGKLTNVNANVELVKVWSDHQGEQANAIKSLVDNTSYFLRTGLDDGRWTDTADTIEEHFDLNAISDKILVPFGLFHKKGMINDSTDHGQSDDISMSSMISNLRRLNVEGSKSGSVAGGSVASASRRPRMHSQAGIPTSVPMHLQEDDETVGALTEAHLGSIKEEPRHQEEVAATAPQDSEDSKPKAAQKDVAASSSQPIMGPSEVVIATVEKLVKIPGLLKAFATMAKNGSESTTPIQVDRDTIVDFLSIQHILNAPGFVRHFLLEPQVAKWYKRNDNTFVEGIKSAAASLAGCTSVCGIPMTNEIAVSVLPNIDTPCMSFGQPTSQHFHFNNIFHAAASECGSQYEKPDSSRNQHPSGGLLMEPIDDAVQKNKLEP